MKRLTSLLAAFSLLTLTGAIAQDSADLIVLGPIYTVDAARTWADAMAVKDGKIAYVGPAAGTKQFQGPKTRILELKPGEMVLPGMVDSHVHLLEGGIEQQNCLLFDLKTKEEVFKAIADYAKAHPDLPWIMGSGWSLPLFPDANPNKADLDAIVPDRPVILASQDGHSAWANSAALKLAGIDKSTPQPPRGVIEHDANGEPTGTLREAAMNLVYNLTPQPTEKQWDDALAHIQKYANSNGLTLIQEANVTAPLLKTYYRAAKANTLNLKVVCAQVVDPGKGPSQIDDMIALRDQFTYGNVTASSAKIFGDGGIEGHTAALLEPYVDQPANTGILNWTPYTFTALAKRLDKEGFQMHTHAIGDKAARVALDAIEAAQKANGRNDNRHHIAHLELVAPEDIPRFRELNVVANFQPFWCYSDSWIVENTEPLLGPERSKRLYQIQSFLNSGAVVCAGSDWTVSSINPFAAIQIGLTRQPIDNPKAPSWLPEERAALADLIAAYTINGAYVNHREKTTGSLEVGKAADFIVIDRNLFATPPNEIGATKVLRTYLDGREVYKAQP